MSTIESNIRVTTFRMSGNKIEVIHNVRSGTVDVTFRDTITKQKCALHFMRGDFEKIKQWFSAVPPSEMIAATEEVMKAKEIIQRHCGLSTDDHYTKFIPVIAKKLDEYQHRIQELAST